MNKHDYIWVAIRIFGLYLLVRAIVAIPSFIAAVMLWRVARYLSPTDVDDQFRGAYQTLSRGARVELMNASVQLILFAVVGFYLVRGGNWLFRVICPPENGERVA